MLDVRSFDKSHPFPEESFFVHKSCLRDVIHDSFELTATQTAKMATKSLGITEKKITSEVDRILSATPMHKSKKKKGG